jgi:hypothetical protein
MQEFGQSQASPAQNSSPLLYNHFISEHAQYQSNFHIIASKLQYCLSLCMPIDNTWSGWFLTLTLDSDHVIVIALSVIVKE